MNKQELSNLMGSGLFGGDDNEVYIKLDQPAIGPVAAVAVSQAYDGFDWDQGRFIIEPETHLVSWEYLEDIHPGIRDMIENERKAYQKRPLRVIVAGGRDIGIVPDERAVIEHAMEGLICPPYVTADKVEIISGCARGVDTVGADIARELGYAVKEFPADWETHGKAAGHIRNRQMAEYAAEDDRKWKGMLLAFWDGESRGTKNMISTAEKLGLTVKVVEYPFV